MGSVEKKQGEVGFGGTGIGARVTVPGDLKLQDFRFEKERRGRRLKRGAREIEPPNGFRHYVGHAL
jgi:hypothetical protein